MAKVSISSSITNPTCIQVSSQRAQAWSTFLTAQGSTGDFEIVHGHLRACATAHPLQYDKYFWIVTQPGDCQVFMTKYKNLSDNISAGPLNKAPRRYAGVGNCTCKKGH